MAFKKNESSTLCIGSGDGSVSNVNRFERPGMVAGVDRFVKYSGHSGAVTGIDFSPLENPEMFLTCSLDWTVKLWSMHVILDSLDVQ
jgi:WD40 repeat protein